MSTGSTPVDLFLAEQRSLTAVDRFSASHDAARTDLLEGTSRYYRDLVPLALPGEGQQYGFEVDLDSCTGCKACVTACHNLNGLDEGESWRAVGLLHGGTPLQPLQQSVTTACHHCVDPACLNGCPTRAFEKDPVTGIVFHHDERCLGCGYCAWTCPYEVPKFNERRGVVRKCDMCRDRLAAGEAPGCVQACPNRAIAISVIDVAERVEAARCGEALLPTAPPSSITIPTTTYGSEWGIPDDLLAGNHFSVAPAAGHTPLVAMLVLTQTAVGAFLAGTVVGGAAGSRARAAGFVLSLLGVAVSLGHLGHPGRAWRSLAGLRRSWLSREVVALGAFAVLSGVAVLGVGPASTRPTLRIAAGVAGIAGVVCSAMLYVATRRPCWCAGLTFARFGSTMLAGGLATALALGAPRSFGWALAAVCTAELVFHVRLAVGGGSAESFERERSALLMTGALRSLTVARLLATSLGGVLLAVVTAAAGLPAPMVTVVAGLSWMAVMAGEMAERSLFFRAAAWSAMPGAPG